jgi:hypothetical protein
MNARWPRGRVVSCVHLRSLQRDVVPLRRIDLVVARLLVELRERRPSTATSVSVSFRAIKRFRR